MRKHTILFLAANPSGTDRLALDEEARAIQTTLERSGCRDKFELQTRWAARPLDLLDELRKLKPTVVHFAGHGGREEIGAGTGPRRDILGESSAVDGAQQHGLYFQGPEGRPQFVSTSALQQTFGAAGGSVQLVVLSACYSEAQVEALLAHVDCVVGMSGSLLDDAARSFAIGLYGGLGERQSVAEAFKQGCAAISLDGLPDIARPQLEVRAGVDATKLVLADHVGLVRDLLVRDLAAWGRRHVFDNKTREQWTDDEAVPFLPLEEMYVEPEGVLVSDGREQPGEPLLSLLEQITAEKAKPQIVIVTADFGSGKSLSARELARRWAERWLTSPQVSLDVPLPIHVRCADDFSGETVDLESTVRRAWKRQADEAGHSVADDDESFAWPSPRQRVVCLLDGLDEVVLGEQQFRTLFERLRGKTTRCHRFVVFSRPGALPSHRDLGANVAVVHVKPFTPGQVEQWLSQWNGLHPDDPPIASEELTKRNLGTIAQTPILLFMIAFTWRQGTIRSQATIAEVYEQFFHQVARGKALADPDPHGPIAQASETLLAAIQNAHILEAGAECEDAMLWLMGRVAWEAHMLEQRRPPEALTRRHLDSLLRESEVSIALDAVDTIRIALILTLQTDLHNANHTLLFGHKSFREFLVGRHWASSLRRLIRSNHGDHSKATESLLGGRLLVQGDSSFDYLMQLINAPESVTAHASSPLNWSDDERARLVRWTQATFEDERLEFGERARPRRRTDATLNDDLRSDLREAALAIGSMTRGSGGIRTSNPSVLRSLLTRFWLTGERTRIVAQGADFGGANLRGADLRGANFRGASLCRADFIHADLIQVDFHGAKLSGALFHGADLRGANLGETDLCGADLSEANLGGANLFHANLTRADLLQANLCGADLCAVNLGEANLIGADLRGTKLWGVNLGGANLREANLSGANLSGARLHHADLSDANLSGTTYSETTIWPEDFDPDAARGAIKWMVSPSDPVGRGSTLPVELDSSTPPHGRDSLINPFASDSTTTPYDLRSSINPYELE